MSVDLSDQLREMCTFIDEEQGPLAVEEVQVRNRAVVLIDQSSGPLPSKRRGLLVAGVAVVVLGLLTPLMLFAGGTESDVANSVPLTTASQAATPSDATTWSRIPHDEAVFGGPDSQGMVDVIGVGTGFVAVGHDTGDAAVWTSANAAIWSRVPHDQAVFGGERTEWIASITATGSGLVAVGEAVGEVHANAVVWTSVDGTSWSRVAHDEDVFGDALMSSVTVGGPGLVAVGSTWAEGDGDVDAVVWTSVDGTSWSRLTHDERVFGGPSNQMMNDITVGGPGFVAVGYDGTHTWDNPNGVAAVWTSPDGMAWSRIPHDESVFGSGGFGFGSDNTAMVSVTTGGPGLVAVGYGFRCRHVWTSVDGLTWSRVPEDVPGACNSVMRSVIAQDSGLVAVGHGAASWTSVDGITWIQVPYDQATPGNDGQRMASLTVGEKGIVAVGVVEIDVVGENGDAAVWLWTD